MVYWGKVFVDKVDGGFNFGINIVEGQYGFFNLFYDIVYCVIIYFFFLKGKREINKENGYYI